MMRARRESKKPTLLKRALACLVSAAMVVAFTPVVAWGAEGDVTYLDASGNKQTCSSATEVTDSTTTWSAGWYVVKDRINLSGVTFNGDVHLILADGCILAVTDGIRGAVASGGERGYSLSIYGQESGTGVLTVSDSNITAGTGGDGDGDGGDGGDVTISGGAVTAASISGGTGGHSSLRNGGDGGNVTISGGAVTAVSISGGCRGTGWDANASADGTDGTFSTGTDGHAVVFAGSIAGQSGKESMWSGLIFVGDQGRIYGQSFALGTDISIPAGKTLTIESGKTLTIAEGKTLVNNGTIFNDGSIRNSGTIENAATFYNSGTIENACGGGITENAPSNTNSTDGTGGIGVIRSAITLHANGGAYSADFDVPSSYVYGGNDVFLPRGRTVSSGGDSTPTVDITKVGHYFAGWYEIANPNKFVSSVPVNGLSAKTYYAKWTPEQNGIAADLYDINFGSKACGYGQLDGKTVTVASTESKVITSIEVAPTSGESKAFKIDNPAVSNGVATFTISPKTWLDVGTYSEVIAIEGTATKEGKELVDVYTYISVSFTVERATPTLTITSSSSTVRVGEVVELEVSSNVALPAGAELALTCTQGTDLFPAEKVSDENIKKIERVDSNRFQVQIVAPSMYGTYRFRADYVDTTGNYNYASAECEITVSLGILIDNPPAFDPPAKETTIVVGKGQEIGVAVSGGQAALKEISQELLQTITTGESSGLQSSFVIDLSNTGSTVTSTKISKESVENIAGAANSSGGGLESLTVKMTSGSVELNRKALSSVASQASGSALIIALKEKEKAELSALQQLALGYERALYGCFDVTATSGDSEIHAFGSGAATLSFPFKPAPNTDPKNYRLVYVSETGKLEYCPTILKGNVLSGTTTHLSTYAIVYIEPDEGTLALTEALGALPKASGLNAAGSKAAVKAARGLLARAEALPDDQRAVVDELVANAEDVVERGNELVAKADEKAVGKVKSKAFTVKAGKSKAIAFKTKTSAAGTRVTYKKAKGSKLITVTKSGKVTAKKGMRAGKKHTAKIKVTCGKSWKYVKITVKVRG